MTRTLTEVEVKKTTTTHNAPRKSAPARKEQPRRASRLLWIIAPLSLLATGSAAFFAVRRWLNSSDSNRDNHQV